MLCDGRLCPPLVSFISGTNQLHARMSKLPPVLSKRNTMEEISNGRDEDTGIFGGCCTPLERPELRSVVAKGHRWTDDKRRNKSGGAQRA